MDHLSAMASSTNILDVAASMKTSINSPAFKKLNLFLQIYFKDNNMINLESYECLKKQEIRDLLTKHDLQQLMGKFLTWLCG
jgi:hypothetical protein